MRTIDIDHKDYQAIRREIGEGLRLELGIELEPPACLKGKVRRTLRAGGQVILSRSRCGTRVQKQAKRERKPRRKVVAHLAVVAQKLTRFLRSRLANNRRWTFTVEWSLPHE